MLSIWWQLPTRINWLICKWINDKRVAKFCFLITDGWPNEFMNVSFEMGLRSACGGGGRTCQGRQASKQHIYSYARGVNHRASISSWPVRVWAQAEESGARVDADDAGLAPEGFPSAPHSPRHRSRSPCARVFALLSQIANLPLIHKIIYQS